MVIKNGCTACLPNCLFDKDVSKLSWEYVNGKEFKRSSELIKGFLGSLDVVIHYFPWGSKIQVSLSLGKGHFLCLFSSVWMYKDKESYQDYLDFEFSDLEDDEK